MRKALGQLTNIIFIGGIAAGIAFAYSGQQLLPAIHKDKIPLAIAAIFLWSLIFCRPSK